MRKYGTGDITEAKQEPEDEEYQDPEEITTESGEPDDPEVAAEG